MSVRICPNGLEACYPNSGLGCTCDATVQRGLIPVLASKGQVLDLCTRLETAIRGLEVGIEALYRISARRPLEEVAGGTMNDGWEIAAQIARNAVAEADELLRRALERGQTSTAPDGLQPASVPVPVVETPQPPDPRQLAANTFLPGKGGGS